MPIWTINSKPLSINGGRVIFSATEPTPGELVSTTGTLKLVNAGASFGSGFNGFGSTWDSIGRKNCAKVYNKTLDVNVTGSSAQFKILDWYRTNSDWPGTYTYINTATFVEGVNSYTFPSSLPDEQLRAFGDNSPIYMEWSACYDSNEGFTASGAIQGASESMFVITEE